MNRSPHFLLLAAFALAGAGCSSGAPDPADAVGTNQAGPLVGARIGGPFTLVDQNGDPASERNLAGRYAIVYFGYSYCPDVCPVDLQKLMQGLRLFERQDPAAAAKVLPVFVTIDPARDTPDVLKTYVAAFHPRLIGLTGTEDQIAAAAKGYAIFYARAKDGGTTEYLMDHSRQTYLMGPDGGPIALLPQDETPDRIAAELARWVR